MSEWWWLSSTSKIQLMLSLLKSDMFLFFALILSHPIYFLYFIFFSPYLFKLLSFLSPLFITTSLFLLAFLTTTAIDEDDNGSSSISTTSTKVSFIITAYRSVVEGLRSRIDNTRGSELLCLEDFEVFRIVFDMPPMIHDNDDKGCRIEVSDPALPPAFPCPTSLASELEAENSGANELEEKLVVNTAIVMEDEKRLEAFLQELDEFDGNVEEEEEEKEEEEKTVAPITKDNKVTEKQEEKCHLQLPVTKGSEAVEVERGSDKGRQSNKTGVVEKNSDEKNVDREENNVTSLSVESSRALEYINLGSCGSMRREKDWKRTLAGKLFEERHTNNNVNSEGMDLLWETYETTEESSSKKSKNKNDSKEEKKNKNNNNNNKKNKYDQDMMKKNYPVKKKELEQQQDDEESDESDGQLCCLQALKFSTTGKMNMGMGRPSLVKISKAIKGFGWLHHVSSRHSKKVHIGDRF